MSGPAFTININHQEARQGATALGAIEKLLQSIDSRLGLIASKAGVANQALAIQNNLWRQTVVNTSIVTNNISQTVNVINQVERSAERVESRFRGVNSQVSRMLVGLSRASAATAGLANRAGGSVLRRGAQSFGGLFNGGGLSGIVGDVVRAPFAVGEFGVRLGGDLAQGLLGGLGKILSGGGGLLGSSIGGLAALGGPAGAVVGSLAAVGSAGLSIAGGAAGISGTILGALGQTAGAVLGAAGELGGQIAESLARGLSKGLTAAGGIALLSLFRAGQFENSMTAFGALAGDADEAAAAIDRIQEATGKTISKLDTARIAALALSLGVVDAAQGIAASTAELEGLFAAARTLGKSQGRNVEKTAEEIFRGLANQSNRVLDNFGIRVNRLDAEKSYAEAIGVTTKALTEQERAIAFNIAAKRQILDTAEKVKLAQDGEAKSGIRLQEVWDRITASFDDASVALGTALAPAATIVGEKITALTSIAETWLTLHRSDIAEGTVAFFESIPGYFDRATTAIGSFASTFARAFGVSDESIRKVGDFVRDPFGSDKGSSALESIKKDLPTVLGNFGDAIVDTFTSEPVVAAVEFLGEKIGLAAYEGLKAGLSATVKPVNDFTDEYGIATKGETGFFATVKRIIDDWGLGFADEILDLIERPFRAYTPIDDVAPTRTPSRFVDDEQNRANLAQLRDEFDTVLDSLGGPNVGSGGVSKLPTAILAGNAAIRSLLPQTIVERGIQTGALLGGNPAAASFAFGGASPAPGAGFGQTGPNIIERVLSSLHLQGYGTDSSGFASSVIGKVAQTPGIDGAPGNLDRAVKAAAEQEIEYRKDLIAAGREAIRAEERRGSAIERIYERQVSAIDSLVESLGATSDAYYEEAAAIRFRSSEAVKEVRTVANNRLGALPNEIANRFAGEIDQPGISTHARHAFARETRLRRRETARDINASFGSRGFEDAFGGVRPGGFGTGTPADDGAFGGLSGSTTSTEATAALLEAVKTSAALADEAAKIRNKALADTAAIELEAAKSRADLDSEFLRTVSEINAAIKGRQANEKKIGEVLAAHQKELAALKATDQLIANQIRSVK